jgi:hypothetical protein
MINGCRCELICILSLIIDHGKLIIPPLRQFSIADRLSGGDSLVMLLLKKHLVELVRAGRKTQTIRVWSRALVQVGKLSYTPGLGKLRITGVDEVANWEALTEADAVADGFADRRALLAELYKLYGMRVPEGRKIYRIKFQYPVLPGEGEDGDEVVVSEPVEVGHGETSEADAAEVHDADAARGADSKVVGRGSEAGLMTVEQREKLRAYVLERRP